jgi:acyl-CoA synthetase (NDP forming)
MKQDIALADCLFSPRHVALLGASGEDSKHTGLAQRYLRQHGYRGRIYPVNPRHAEIHGERAYARIADVGGAIDHAFIMLPTKAVLGALAECGQAGVPCVTILANGFAESGEEGLRLQSRLLAVAREYGMRILGPNSLGLINLTGHVALSVSEVLSLPEIPVGRYGVISQSGGMMGALLSHGQARGIGFSRMVSTGNEADLTVGEIGEMLVDDPGTDAILLFLETIREPARVEAMVRRAHAAGKPVVAYCMGRTALGEQLAAAHTGAISGSGAAMTAFLRDIGVVRVDILETLLGIAPMLKGRKPAAGRRVAVMSTTGGGGGLVVDCLSGHDIEIAPPATEIRRRLDARGIVVGESPLIDLTLTGTNASTYGAVLTELLAYEGHDAVIAVVGASSQFRPDRAVEPIAAAVQGANDRPLAVFLTPSAEESFRLLQREGVAAFRTPETCADAVRAYLDWQAPREVQHEMVDTSALSAILRANGPGLLDAGAAGRLVDALGITRPETRVLPPDVAGWSDAVLASMRYPVVAKIVSPDLAHKTEAGGVTLDIRSPAALREAAVCMLQRIACHQPAARLDGVEVQHMEHGLMEVLIGYRRDAHVGPTITVSVGGILTELYRDFATRLAPVSTAGALAMVQEVRALAAIRGFRNLPRGDVDALAAAIVALSRLALVADPLVMEAEMNPVIVKPAVDRMGEPGGVVAVDALVIRA